MSRQRGRSAKDRILAAHRAQPTATNRQIARVTGHHVSTVARHRPARAAVTPATLGSPVAAATLRPTSQEPEPSDPKESRWWPPGLAPDFADRFEGLLGDGISPRALDELSDSDDWDVVIAVALHPRTRDDTLVHILCREQPLSDVRWAVIANPGCPEEALTEICDSLSGPPYTPAERSLYEACVAHPNWDAPADIAAGDDDKCDACGDPIDLDGYDGYCGNCADRLHGDEDDD